MILTYHPAAIQEAQDSAEWYNRREHGLGMEFSAPATAVSEWLKPGANTGDA